VSFNNLAAIRQAKGEAGEAEELYRRALAIKEKVLGTDHPDTALTVHNIATLLAALGRSAEAEALYGRALAVFETALGAEHPHTGICREGLAAVRGR
jgi:tetratricopeptide (TPR) repeat protein